MAATVPSKKIGGGSGAAGQREYTVRALTWHARHATSKSQEKKPTFYGSFIYLAIPYCIFLGLFQSTMTLTKEKTIWIKLLKLYKWNFLLILEIVIQNERYVE